MSSDGNRGVSVYNETAENHINRKEVFMSKTYQCVKCGNEQETIGRGCEECGDEFSLMVVEPEDGEDEDDDGDSWEKEMDDNLVDEDEKPHRRRRRRQ